jgi:hypothetical protein
VSPQSRRRQRFSRFSVIPGIDHLLIGDRWHPYRTVLR